MEDVPNVIIIFMADVIITIIIIILFDCIINKITIIIVTRNYVEDFSKMFTLWIINWHMYA